MRGPVQSVRSKLMLVVLATTIAALVVAAIALVVYESRTYERSTADGLMTQAQILARSTAPALVFDDPVAARENLALLKLQPQILAAAVYTPGGRLFASYGTADLAARGRWGRNRSSSCSLGSPRWDPSQTISPERLARGRTGQRPRGVYSVPAGDGAGRRRERYAHADGHHDAVAGGHDRRDVALVLGDEGVVLQDGLRPLVRVVVQHAARP